MRIYAREGVRHLWLADPLARTLDVYRLQGGEEGSGRSPAWLLLATHAAVERVRAEPFAAIELDLARCWTETA